MNRKKNDIPKSAPYINHETIFAGSDVGLMTAFHLDGRVKWRYRVRETERGVHSSPVGFDGNIYFGSYDGFFYCLSEESGNLVWETRLGQWIGSSAAVIPEARLVAVGIEYGEAGGALTAMDVDQGAVQWTFPVRGYLHASPYYDAKRKQLIVGANDRTLYALDINGQERWRFVTDGEIKARPIVDDEGRCFFGSFDGDLYALDAETGRQIWRRRVGSCVYFAPLIFNDLVIVGSHSCRLIAFERASGNVRWVMTTGGRISGGAVRVGDNLLAFGSADGVLYLTEGKTGRVVGQYRTGDEIRSTPAVAGNTIFVPSLDEHLYALTANV